MVPTCFMSLFVFFIFHLVSQSVTLCHPLDPVTPSEINTIRRTIQGSHLGSTKNLTFYYVAIDDPDKPTLLSWQSNRTKTPPPRQAFVIVRSNGQTHEIASISMAITSSQTASTAVMVTRYRLSKNRSSQVRFP